MTAPIAPPTNGFPTPPGLDDAMPSSPIGRGEIGRPANITTVYSTRAEKQWAPKWADPNRLLRFPESIKAYDAMLRSDDQVDSVFRAVTLPILDAGWTLETKGVRPEVVDFVRREIGLPKEGDGPMQRRRGSAGIVFSEHLEEALDALGYGFAPFEQVYTTTFPGDVHHPEGPLFAGIPCVHLSKLASRPPATIRRFRLARDGGLVSIIQHPIEGDPVLTLTTDGDNGIEIGVDRLVVYVTGKKGADWSGVSILRSAYGPWKVKEELRRLDAVASERNSLGLPYVEYDPTVMSREAALAVAMSARSGAEAGVVVPINAARFSFVGVTGQVVDLTPKIEAYNQAIGRASLAMFLNLGHDNGARALGDTFLSIFTRSLQHVAKKMGTTFTEHVIRDLIEWNFGPEEAYPRLVPGEITAESIPPESLKALVDAKIIIPDDKLEGSTRRRYRLPPADVATAREDKPPEPAAVAPSTGQPNPFLPADVPPPGTATPAGGEVPGAKPPPPGEKPPPPGTKAADEDPEEGATRSVHVPAHDRKWPERRSADLAGYIAYLNSIIEIETEEPQ